MNKLKKWAFVKMMENDNERVDFLESKDKTSNNDMFVTNSPTEPSYNGVPKKRKRRLLVILLLVLTIGTVIGLIVYFSLRQTEIYSGPINQIEKVQDKEDPKVYTFKVTTKDNKTYSIDPNSRNSFAYYLGNNSYQIFADIYESDLPLSFRAQMLQSQESTSNTDYDWYVEGVDITQLVVTVDPGSGAATPNPEAAKDFTTWLKTKTTLWTVQPEPFPWFSLVSLVLPIVVFILLAYFFFKMSKMQTGGAEGIFGIGKSGAQIAKSNVKFSDVAGIKEEKVELSEIVDYLKRPQKYAAMGARTPRGVILYGPPGTGKTLLAKAVAGEAGVAFFQISGSQFEDMLVGVGAKRVRDLFAKARKSAPAIIFIDEIDSVASKRGKNEFGGGLADQTINQLLAEMDGFNTSSGIVVIAATNRLDVLDEAILRPGRFDRHIQVNLPDIKEREEILKIHARNKNISTKVSLYDIARRTPGFSGAQLENVLNEATLLTVREDKTTIGVDEIDEAIDRVIAGPAKKSKVISPSEKELIAYHEAGHALVGLFTPGSEVVQKITIIPRGAAAGYTMQTPEDVEKNIQSKKDLLGMIRMTLGGRAAEEVIFGPESITTGASNDLYKVTNVARSMVTQLGMSKAGMTQFFPSEGFINPYQQQKLFSDEKQKQIDKEIEDIIQVEYDKAKNIIRKNKKELELIVETLLILETILKDQIDYIHKYKKLPKEAIEQKAQQKKQKGKKQVDEESKEKDDSSNNELTWDDANFTNPPTKK